MPTLAELLLAAAGLAVLLAAYAYSRTSAAAATGAQTQTQMQKQTQTGLGPIEPLTGACARPPAQLRPFKPVYHITMGTYVRAASRARVPACRPGRTGRTCAPADTPACAAGSTPARLADTRAGLKNATPSEWITIDADFAARLALRASLLAAKGRGVYGVVRGGEAAALELHRALHAYLPLRFPDVFSTKAGRLHNRATGASFPSASAVADPLAALQQIATTVEEDFFVLRQDADEQTGEHRCVAFVCCFPSGFDPAGKLGRGLAAIHAPVPSYARIGPSMERFFARVQVGRPVRRVNWAVQLGAELFNSGSNHIVGDEDEDVDVDPDAVDVADVSPPRRPVPGRC